MTERQGHTLMQSDKNTKRCTSICSDIRISISQWSKNTASSYGHCTVHDCGQSIVSERKQRQSESAHSRLILSSGSKKEKWFFAKEKSLRKSMWYCSKWCETPKRQRGDGCCISCSLLWRVFWRQRSIFAAQHVRSFNEKLASGNDGIVNHFMLAFGRLAMWLVSSELIEEDITPVWHLTLPAG